MPRFILRSEGRDLQPSGLPHAGWLTKPVDGNELLASILALRLEKKIPSRATQFFALLRGHARGSVMPARMSLIWHRSALCFERKGCPNESTNRRNSE